MACRSGCKTQDHANWGDCAKSIQIGNLGRGVSAAMVSKAHDADMDAYKRLRKQGVDLPEVSGSAFKEKHADTPEQMAVRIP